MRRLDAREPHSCHGAGGAGAGGGGASCRNVIIDLKLSSRSTLNQPTQCKCIDINPVRPEQIAVGASDEYARIYDARLCSVRSPSSHNHGGKFPSHLPISQDPSCIRLFSPGHLSFPSSLKSRGGRGGVVSSFCSNVASTYISFSRDGRELLVNLSGEQVYLYDTVNPLSPVSYSFDPGKVDSVPVVRPVSRTCTHHISGGVSTQSGGSSIGDGGIGMKLMPFMLEPCSIPVGETADELKLGEEIVRLRNTAKELFKQDKLDDALRLLNEAISQCPNWHALYFLRGTTLYSRKWYVCARVCI